MPLFLFVVFVVLPALEIFVIVVVAHTIGFGATMLLLLAGAVLGSYVMRRAGASWWRALRGRVTTADGSGLTGQRPDGRAAAQAALLFLAGLLIFLPGFVSDAVGLLLLLPPVRGLLQAATAAWFTRRFSAVSGPGGVRIWNRPAASGPRPGDIVPGEVVHGDIVREDQDPEQLEPPSR